jgi:ornithine cyclodeaminase/alanine dehydrogenase-like protein (mu-crystallin family)
MRDGIQTPEPAGPGSASAVTAPRLVTADDVAAALPVGAAIDALAQAFGAGHALQLPTRTQLPLADGTMLVMPAVVESASDGPVGGVKVVTVRRANAETGAPSVQAVYLLFGGETLSPLAVVDGVALTDLRTSAVSALVARQLALPQAHRLLIFGAGAQARAHLRAFCAVRPVDEVIVVGRDVARAAALVDEAAAMGLAARAGEPGDVAQADLVCTCTTSPRPLFDGAMLQPGTHVTAVGAYQPHTRELDDTTVTRGRLVVEDRAAALAEAGELCLPIVAGLLREGDIVADLSELCRGAVVRRSAGDITVFKSVGLALEDLVVADAVVRGLGDRG